MLRAMNDMMDRVLGPANDFSYSASFSVFEYAKRIFYSLEDPYTDQFSRIIRISHATSKERYDGSSAWSGK